MGPCFPYLESSVRAITEVILPQPESADDECGRNHAMRTAVPE